MKQEVFISYSSKNSEVAHHICEVLEQQGIGCWIAPRNITAGNEWGAQIIEGIEGSRILVLIFSSYSNESQQVLREVERAVSKKLVIIAFRIEDVVPTKSMEYFLYSNHWLNAFDGNIDKKIIELSHTIHKLAEGIPEPPLPMLVHEKSKGSSAFTKKNILKGVGTGVLVMAVFVIAYNLNEIRLKLSESAPVGQSVEAVQDVVTTNNETVPVVEQKAIDFVTRSEGVPVQEAGGKKVDTNSASPNQGNENHKETATIAPEDQKQKYEQKQEQTQQAVPVKEEVNIPKVSVGQMIRFGSYYSQPIDWLVIDVDEKGNPLLLTQNIVTLKSFDAAESGVRNQSKNGNKFDPRADQSLIYTDYTPGDLREMKGSNRWSKSNIREWLNSSNKNVAYSTAPPVGSGVSGGLNDYSKEAGFLTYFSEDERSAILPVSHKAVLSEMDKAVKDGGSARYNFTRSDIGQSLFNISDAYYETVQDKVFLLSVDEVNTYIVDRGWEARVGLTPEAIEKDKSGWYKDLKGQTGGYHMWWLRTPVGKSPSEICCVGTKGDVIYQEFTDQAGVGVRPALKLDLRGLLWDGTGTDEDPYRIK